MNTKVTGFHATVEVENKLIVINAEVGRLGTIKATVDGKLKFFADVEEFTEYLNSLNISVTYDYVKYIEAA
ncbi:hypothetical protein D3C74_51210 [compost metagenome]